MAPRERFELPRDEPTRFPVARTTRLCDLGRRRSYRHEGLTTALSIYLDEIKPKVIIIVTLPLIMSEVHDLNHETSLNQNSKDKPFHLDDMKPWFPTSEASTFTVINDVQKEMRFMFSLAKHDWNKAYITTMLSGIIAFLLGSISLEIFSGGDAQLSGFEGITAISGLNYFQLIISVLLWIWFLYNTWILFPVMRTHTISLMIMWNIITGAMIFFHSQNTSFPVDFKLSQMMQGTLLILIASFFLYFFWKAVIETRDLHIELYHVHEDVRIMEKELKEHSLGGWSALFFMWVALIMLSSWNGTHFISTRGTNSAIFMVLHLIFGIASIPVLLVILWYPQRMLGVGAVIQTRAARYAEEELLLQTNTIEKKQNILGTCASCHSESKLRREEDGTISHPCLKISCRTSVKIGTACSSCSTELPSRFECQQCGTNAPALDYFPNNEAW